MFKLRHPFLNLLVTNFDRLSLQDKNNSKTAIHNESVYSGFIIRNNISSN